MSDNKTKVYHILEIVRRFFLPIGDAESRNMKQLRGVVDEMEAIT